MQNAWERAMGMRGYLGSPAAREDRAEGIKVGGCVQSKVTGTPLIGTITEITIDEDGDPHFTLSFAGDHKDVVVEREDIMPLNPRR